MSTQTPREPKSGPAMPLMGTAFVLIASLGLWVAVPAVFSDTGSGTDAGRIVNALVGCAGAVVFAVSLVGLAVAMKD